jgi:hypothetical protein
MTLKKYIPNLPTYPYQVLAAAIRTNSVDTRMLDSMFLIRRFLNEMSLNQDDVQLIIRYIETVFPIDDYPEKYI